MASVEDLLRVLPIRDLKVRAGTAGNCGGIVVVIVDLEPGVTAGLEVVDAEADLPGWVDDDLRFIIDGNIENIVIGVRAALREQVGTEPPVRLVLRRLHANPVDANLGPCRRAGRRIVEEAVGLAYL